MLIARESARTASKPTLPPTAPAKVATLCAFDWLADLEDMAAAGGSQSDTGVVEGGYQERRGASASGGIHNAGANQEPVRYPGEPANRIIRYVSEWQLPEIKAVIIRTSWKSRDQRLARGSQYLSWYSAIQGHCAC